MCLKCALIRQPGHRHPQMVKGKVGIDLSDPEIAVAEQFLYRNQVNSGHHQMGSKCMPQGMKVDIWTQLSFLYQPIKVTKSGFNLFPFNCIT